MKDIRKPYSYALEKEKQDKKRKQIKHIKQSRVKLKAHNMITKGKPHKIKSLDHVKKEKTKKTKDTKKRPPETQILQRFQGITGKEARRK